MAARLQHISLRQGRASRRAPLSPFLCTYGKACDQAVILLPTRVVLRLWTPVDAHGTAWAGASEAQSPTVHASLPTRFSAPRWRRAGLAGWTDTRPYTHGKVLRAKPAPLVRSYLIERCLDSYIPNFVPLHIYICSDEVAGLYS